MRVTKTRMILGALVLAVLALGVWVSSPSSFPRQVWTGVRTMECYERPHDGRDVAGLGDSITDGGSRHDLGFQGPNSWLSHLTCDGSPSLVVNAAEGGDTAQQIAGRVGEVVGRRPKVTVVLAGTNNVHGGLPASAAIAAIDRTVAALRAGGVRPILATIPPQGGRHQADVPTFNRAISRLARRRDVPVIDFYAALADPTGKPSQRLFIDDLHPNVDGSKLMARAALPVVRAEIARAR